MSEAIFLGDVKDLGDFCYEYNITPRVLKYNYADFFVSWFNIESYDAQAYVLLRKGDVPYVSEGSHCSCDDFSGQFDPKPVSAAWLNEQCDRTDHTYGAWADPKFVAAARKFLIDLVLVQNKMKY